MNFTALCAFRNASDYLPEFIQHLEPYVDGVIMLDDRSRPDEAQLARGILGAYDIVKSLFNRASRTGEAHAFETQNRQILLREALAEGATHVLCLDADERVETNFLRELRHFTDPEDSHVAVSLRVRDLWNSPNQYRADGVWEKKRKPVFFRLLADRIRGGENVLHQSWLTHWTLFNLEPDYNLYHLGSLTPELRAARVAKFNKIDPESKFNQPWGYDYLNDDTNLRLETIPPGRGFSPRISQAARTPKDQHAK